MNLRFFCAVNSKCKDTQWRHNKTDIEHGVKSQRKKRSSVKAYCSCVCMRLIEFAANTVRGVASSNEDRLKTSANPDSARSWTSAQQTVVTKRSILNKHRSERPGRAADALLTDTKYWTTQLNVLSCLFLWQNSIFRQSKDCQCFSFCLFWSICNTAPPVGRDCDLLSPSPRTCQFQVVALRFYVVFNAIIATSL